MNPTEMWAREDNSTEIKKEIEENFNDIVELKRPPNDKGLIQDTMSVISGAVDVGEPENYGNVKEVSGIDLQSQNFVNGEYCRTGKFGVHLNLVYLATGDLLN